MNVANGSISLPGQNAVHYSHQPPPGHRANRASSAARSGRAPTGCQRRPPSTTTARRRPIGTPDSSAWATAPRCAPRLGASPNVVR